MRRQALIPDAKPEAAAVIAAAVAVMLSCASASAQIQGVLIDKSGGRHEGTITYVPSADAYDLAVGNITRRVPRAQVSRVVVPKPPQLDAAIRKAQAGQIAAAVPELQKVYIQYNMMGWDIDAARWLAECSMKLKNAKEALRWCERVIQANPEAAVSGPLVRVYWDALLEDKQLSKLDAALKQAIEKGSRGLAAAAQVLRGDILRKQGNTREALVDGYLRTVVFFAKEKEVRPEALYKAMECFKELGQHQYAEKMRQMLLSEYPDNPYTERAKSAS